MTKAAVFGSGSWGTTFAMILAEAGTETILWGRRAEVVVQEGERAWTEWTASGGSPLQRAG